MTVRHRARATPLRAPLDKRPERANEDAPALASDLDSLPPVGVAGVSMGSFESGPGGAFDDMSDHDSGSNVLHSVDGVGQHETTPEGGRARRSRGSRAVGGLDVDGSERVRSFDAISKTSERLGVDFCHSVLSGSMGSGFSVDKLSVPPRTPEDGRRSPRRGSVVRCTVLFSGGPLRGVETFL